MTDIPIGAFASGHRAAMLLLVVVVAVLAATAVGLLGRGAERDPSADSFKPAGVEARHDAVP